MGISLLMRLENATLKALTAYPVGNQESNGGRL